jgi:hypothetical protein
VYSLGDGQRSFTGPKGHEETMRVFRTPLMLTVAVAFGGSVDLKGAFVNVNGSIAGGCSFSTTASVSQMVSNSCGGEFSPGGPGGVYTILGSSIAGIASYNSLKAYAFQDIVITSRIISPQVSTVLATAFFDDSISLPSSYHQPAFVTFGWTASGVGPGTLTLFWGADCVQNIVSSSATCSLTQMIQPGSTYQLEAEINANATVSFSGFPGNELSQLSDYSHTAILTQVSLFDQNMNPLTGVQLVSQSGFNYQQNVLSSAPEPSSFTLILCGIGIVGRIGFKRLFKPSVRLKSVPARSVILG